jgi:hypothetical protein
VVAEAKKPMTSLLRIRASYAATRGSTLRGGQPAAEADLEAAAPPKVAAETRYPRLVDGPLTAIA